MGLALRHVAAPLLHKSVDPSRMTVTAALTYPCTDRAGDYVRPDGIDWAVHKADPWVGLEHYRWTRDRTDWVLPGPRDVDLEPVRVGSAAGADGRYAVELKAMREGPIPFGTTHFANSRLGTQTFRLVEDGTLDGVSIEFTLRKGCYSELGPSPLENRPAYRVESCTGLGWVHCVTPVNPGALVLKALHSAAAEKATRVVRDGRVGVEEAHPLILKALSRFAPGKPTTVTSGFARVEKAMADSPEMEPAYETPENDAGGGGPANGVEAFYDHAQQLLALCESMEAAMDATDSPELIDAATKLLPKIEALAEQLKGHADKHDAKLQAKRSGKEEPAEEEDAEPDMEVDGDGVLKAMRPCFYKAIKARHARRISKAEADAAPVVATDTPEAIAAALAEDAAADRRLAKARRVAG
jgi:hypothetical protein